MDCAGLETTPRNDEAAACAGVGERHGDAGVFRHELSDGFDFGGETELRDDDAAAYERQERVGTALHVSEQKGCLTEASFAGVKGRAEAIERFPRPGVVWLACVEQGDEWPRIDDRSHRP